MKRKFCRGCERLQNINISELIVANNMKTEEELMVKAQQQFADGKNDLKKFILSKSLKSQYDLTKGGKGRKSKMLEKSLFPKVYVKNCRLYLIMKQLQIYST